MPRRAPKSVGDERSTKRTAQAASGTAIVAPVEIDPFTLKQRIFIEAYIGRARGNATESARLAGYSGDDNTLSSTGWDLLRNPAVSREIDRRRKEFVAAISPERLIISALEEAESSVEDFITVNADGTFSVDLVKAQQNGKLHLLDGVEHDRESGAPILKMPSRRAAREFIAKMLGYSKNDNPAPSQNNTTVQVLAILGDLGENTLREVREAVERARLPASTE